MFWFIYILFYQLSSHRFYCLLFGPRSGSQTEGRRIYYTMGIYYNFSTLDISEKTNLKIPIIIFLSPNMPKLKCSNPYLCNLLVQTFDSSQLLIIDLKRPTTS